MTEEYLTVMTFNLWGDRHWEDRKDALSKCLKECRPDILCVQEFPKEAEKLIDSALPDHDHVDPKRDLVEDVRFAGWGCEGNIYWHKNILELAKGPDGREYIGRDKVAIHKQLQQEHRRLFWVRLTLRDTGRTVFVSTAQLTFKGSPADNAGLNPRKKETRHIIRALKNRILKNEHGKLIEPAFFMGDVNDTSPIFLTVTDFGEGDCS